MLEHEKTSTSPYNYLGSAQRKMIKHQALRRVERKRVLVSGPEAASNRRSIIEIKENVNERKANSQQWQRKNKGKREFESVRREKQTTVNSGSLGIGVGLVLGVSSVP